MNRLILTLLGLYCAASFSGAQGPSYLQEIVPILTKQGCNQGACHGKGSGQNGFRLSLRGYAPEEDHRSITREFDGRRADPTDPANSLLLRKAIADVPHEGGRIFTRSSREYQSILAWIAAGAAGPSPKELPITKLELTPADLTLAVSGTSQLKAWATFSDGSRRDVTWLTKFESNDAGVTSVTPDGHLTAQRTGATAIRASYLTEVAVATTVIPNSKPIDPARFALKNNFVDEHVFAKLAALRIEPSDLTTDGEFLRRVYLDSCGILPKPEELTKFLADPRPDKRQRMIDDLLQRPEFNDYWTLQLSDLLQNRKERDHDVRGIKGVRQFHEWIRQQVQANRPWDALVRDVLTATGNSSEHPAIGYYIVTVGEQRHGENSEAPESVAQAFLGTRIGCAKCHNHPLERYTQDDYYHFAAFFSRVKFDRKESKQGPTHLHNSHPDENQNKRPVGVKQPRTGQFLAAQPLDRVPVVVKPGHDPRVTLAEWITRPTNTAFTGAIVNRVWKHYLGVGLVEPVDDLRATNPPSVPALDAA
ncbi:MAG: DUF1549 domain-containing protein, partial [Gemmataceae bacterium]